MSEHRQATVIAVSADELRSTLADPSSRAEQLGAEQRGAVRVPAELQLDIPLPSWDEVRRVYTCNISHGGLMFRTRPPVRLPGRASVVLTLPDGQQLTLPSEIRHAARVRRDTDPATDQPGESQAEIEIGVQFKSLPPDALATLRAALAAAQA